MFAIFVTCARSNDQQIAINTSKLTRIESIDLPDLRRRDEVQTARIDLLESRCPEKSRASFEDVTEGRFP